MFHAIINDIINYRLTNFILIFYEFTALSYMFRLFGAIVRLNLGVYIYIYIHIVMT
jgi:hypothetical protein